MIPCRLEVPSLTIFHKAYGKHSKVTQTRLLSVLLYDWPNPWKINFSSKIYIHRTIREKWGIKLPSSFPCTVILPVVSTHVSLHFRIVAVSVGIIQIAQQFVCWHGDGQCSCFPRFYYSHSSLSFPHSCPGWFQAGSQAEADWGKSGTASEGGDDQDSAAASWAKQRGVGADPHSDRSSPKHQCTGQPLEATQEVLGET